MECNKDEAIRAKDISVRKFTERDFAGSKKFALKAQNLYPGLEGISQMLTTLEVYISAENKVNGEMDMYGILGVDPLADDEIIKKHYRKLVLLLHPDKNKSIGADGAFQLVSEAFNFLSDKAKRSAYNSRRNIRTAQQKVPSQPGVSAGPARFRQFQQKVPTPGGVSAASPSTGRPVDQKGKAFRSPGNSASQQKVPPQSGSSTIPPQVNGYHKHSINTSASGKPQKSSSQKASSSATTQGVFKREDTFWTVCTRCKMQYEYMRFYINQTLKCPHCQVGFVAVEVPPPSNLSPIRPQPQQQQQNSSYSSGRNIFGSSSSFGDTGARWSPLSGTTAYRSTTSSRSNATQATSVSQVVNERVKRGYEEAQAGTRWEMNNGCDLLKKRREDDSFVRNSGRTIPAQTGTGNMGFTPGQSQENRESGRANFFQDISLKFNVNQELSLMETRKILTEKALLEISKKLKERKMSIEAKEREKIKQKERQKSKLAKNVAFQELETCKESSDIQKGSLSKKSSMATSDGNTEQEVVEMVAMSVPDPDFHIFDLDRSESCFGENQVWATYDNTDGMPRYYAMIHEVISLNPFKLRISWLNSKSNSEFGPLDWIGHGFSKICGEFRIGKHETNKLLNSFSHKVKWVKGARGVVQIYPQKGDIWALYRNWSPDWNVDTPDEVIQVYDMVEVLDDYNEEQGVSVAPLIKAAGFRTVFSKQPDLKEVKRIPKEEMFRFSHQVPCHVLTGEEKPNAPKGYVELDPAATSADLLQVIAPANQEQVTGTGPNR